MEITDDFFKLLDAEVLELAAEAIAGQAERFDLYGRLHHRVFPGGRWLRTPALVLGMLWYRLRDLL